MTDAIRAAIKQATELAESAPEPYRVAAFREVLRVVLTDDPSRVSIGSKQTPSRQGDKQARPVSLAEYFSSLKREPKNNAERLAVAAAYGEDCLGESSITRNALLDRLKSIRIIPKNPFRDFQKALRPPTAYLQTLAGQEGVEILQLTRRGRTFVDGLHVSESNA